MLYPCSVDVDFHTRTCQACTKAFHELARVNHCFRYTYLPDRLQLLYVAARLRQGQAMLRILQGELP